MLAFTLIQPRRKVVEPQSNAIASHIVAAVTQPVVEVVSTSMMLPTAAQSQWRLSRRLPVIAKLNSNTDHAGKKPAASTARAGAILLHEGSVREPPIAATVRVDGTFGFSAKDDGA